MQNQQSLVAIQGSVSVAQCSLLRDKVEGSVFENSGLPVHAVPVPGAQFWQLNSSIMIVTYMLLGDDVYCWDAVNYRWRRMFISASQITGMKFIVKRIG